jgi:hypothetical protein
MRRRYHDRHRVPVFDTDTRLLRASYGSSYERSQKTIRSAVIPVDAGDCDIQAISVTRDPHLAADKPLVPRHCETITSDRGGC